MLDSNPLRITTKRSKTLLELCMLENVIVDERHIL